MPRLRDITPNAGSRGSGVRRANSITADIRTTASRSMTEADQKAADWTAARSRVRIAGVAGV